MLHHFWAGLKAVLSTESGDYVRSKRARPILEVLEDRTVPASFTPTTVAELIADIGTANGNNDVDVIDLGGNVFTLTAEFGAGNGLPAIAIDGGNALTIQNGTIQRDAGAANFRILQVDGSAALNLDRVTIRGGNSSEPGAGIHNLGTLNLTGSTVSGNTAETAGGGIYNGSSGTLNITNSTISGNTATPSSLGGPENGGGIYNFRGSFTITNSTIASNTAGAGGGLWTATFGGETTVLNNTIIANNVGGAEADLSVRLSDGALPIGTANNNLIEDADGANGVVNGANGNIVGLGDPNLGALADNGGPTQTHALLTGSDAIDAGSNTFVASPPFSGPPFFDQRGTGFSRIINSTVDIGAYEAAVVDLVVTTTESIEPVVAGSGAGNLTYVVTVTNNGPSDATGVVLSEDLTLPAGVTRDSVVVSAGTFTDTTAPDGTWNLGNLASGASATLTVVMTVSSSAASGTDVISNTAAVTAANEPLISSRNDSATVSTSVTREVDLVVTTTESVDPVAPGSGAGNLTYVVTVTNNGPSDATNIFIDENLTLPAGVTRDSVVVSAGTFTDFVAPDGFWDIPNLASGASATMTIVMTVSSSAALGTDVIGNTASLSGVFETLINTGDDSSTVATSIAHQVDLVVTTTESIEPVVAGSGAGNLTYVVTVTNNGPSDATGVVLSEDLTLPAGVTRDSVVVSAGTFTDTTAPDGTWNLGNLARGASATLTVVMTVTSSAASGTNVIGNTATVTAADQTLINTGDDSSTVATSIARQVDLVVTTTESIEPVIAGSGAGNLTYVVTVTNSGPSDATGVILSDDLTLPAGVTRDSVVVSAGTFTDTTAPDGTWNLGNLARGASATLTVVMTVTSSAAVGTDVIGNTAAVAANETLINTANDSATVNTSVTRQVDLVVTTTESIEPVIAGSGAGNLTYVVTVTNNGPSDATGVVLSEDLTLPIGVTRDSVVVSAGTFADTTAPDGTWNLGNLARGASATLTVVMTVSASAASGTDVIGNSATVSAANETLINTANDSATVNTSVTRQVDLVVTTTESIEPVIAGSGAGNLTYVVTVTNNGPSDATGVVLSEDLTLPAGVTRDSVVVSAGTFTDTTAPDGTWNVGNLASGASATLTVVMTVTSSAAVGTDVISNTAAVAAANETLINTADDSATVSTSVSSSVAPALTVTINQAATQVDPTLDSPINFTVVFSRAVTGFTDGDVTLGGTAGATTAVVTGSGTTYNVAVSGMTECNGTVIATIGAGAARDTDNNANLASTSTDNSVFFGPPTSDGNIFGTEGDDVILVRRGERGCLEVFLNGVLINVIDPAVTTLFIDGLGGNDEIEVQADLELPSSILGGDGNDTIRSAAGNDTLDGGLGDDSLSGLDGDDLLIGGEGNDTLDGNGGNDSISGGSGNDLLFGSVGDDVVFGEDGNDSLDGGDGNDSLGGGSGDDLMFGSTGNDLIRGDDGNDSMDGGEGNDSVDGGMDDDLLFGSGGDDVLSGGEGNDSLEGGEGNDVVFGGAGHDLLLDVAGNDSMDGGDGNDSMGGGVGNDLLFGSGGNDLMFGVEGNDSMDGGAGSDTMDGGLGDDLMFGSAGNDSMFGQAGNDSMDGGDGDDFMEAAEGNDLVFGSLGNDLIFAGVGNDSIDGNDGADAIDADAGDDLVFGSAGDDLIFGGLGNDSIDGGPGFNRIDAGPGINVVVS